MQPKTCPYQFCPICNHNIIDGEQYSICGNQEANDVINYYNNPSIIPHFYYDKIANIIRIVTNGFLIESFLDKDFSLVSKTTTAGAPIKCPLIFPGNDLTAYIKKILMKTKPKCYICKHKLDYVFSTHTNNITITSSCYRCGADYCHSLDNSLISYCVFLDNEKIQVMSNSSSNKAVIFLFNSEKSVITLDYHIPFKSHNKLLNKIKTILTFS